jgi:hypothetical protein
MSDNRQKLEAIFDAAVELNGPERDIYLARACGDDQHLRRRVEKLLQALNRAGDFLTRGEPTSELVRIRTQTKIAKRAILSR